MKKKIQFWWHYITNRSFRGYVHLHDIQAYQDKIKRMMEEKAMYESKRLYEVTTNHENQPH